MGVRLVVIDHHVGALNLNNYNNITIIKTDSLDFFNEIVGRFLDDKYDLVISDEDPDGILSSIIYMLGKNKKLRFLGNRSGLSSTSLADFEKQGISNIIAFDWFALNYSQLESFDEIIILNPVLSNLPNINTTEIVYNALASNDNFLRDLSAIGTLCDYKVDECKERFSELLNDYRDLFPELHELSLNNQLDKYNIYRLNNSYTKFFDISLMFWAPYILRGQEGIDELIRLLTTTPKFTLNDLVNDSYNESANYLKTLFKELLLMINDERIRYNADTKILGNVYMYTMHSNAQGFMSKFSSIMLDEISEKNPEAVIVMKSANGSIVKYSLRSRYSNYELGKLLGSITENGGGHPTAAGVVLENSKVEEFETKLVSAINNFREPLIL